MAVYFIKIFIISFFLRYIQGQTNEVGYPLVVLALPRPTEPYYQDFWDEIVKFQISYAKQILYKDNVIIMGDSSALRAVRSNRALGGTNLPQDIFLEAPIEDIWMRDFSPVRMSRQQFYRYEPNFQSRWDSIAIQNSLRNFLSDCGIPIGSKSSLILDGGNVVDNDKDKAILTSRILSDNPNSSDQQIKSQFGRETGLSKVAIIPEEAGDTTGHSDGMVSFLDEDVVAITDLDEGLMSRVKSALKAAFGDEVSTVVLPNNYTPSTWRGFGSACGLHINLLATDDFLYVPTFGSDLANPGQSTSLDDRVLKKIQENSWKKVVGVPVPNTVCRMGGSVRCLSWQVEGQLADALILKARSSHGCRRN